jgi:LmbE family N-acetylglucosaminyl deacetylase
VSSTATPLPPLLAFGAHPDDIEFGAGGIIALETAAGRPVHFVVCSRGEAGTNGTPAVRTAEAEKAAALLGVTLEFIDLGGDAHFVPSLPHSLTIAAIIRRVKPALVLAPTVNENQHPDHSVLGKIVRNASRLARYGGVAELRGTPAHAINTLLHYAITSDAEARDASPVLVDVSPVIATWTAAMQAHASQAATRDYVELQLTRARFHGLRAGVAQAIPLWPADPLVVNSLDVLSHTARRF